MTVDCLGKVFVERAVIERTEYWAELGYGDGTGDSYWQETYYSSGPYSDRSDAVSHLLQHTDMEKSYLPGWASFEGSGLRNGRNYGTARIRASVVREGPR